MNEGRRIPLARKQINSKLAQPRSTRRELAHTPRLITGPECEAVDAAAKSIAVISVG